MSGEETKLVGPDLGAGIEEASIPDGGTLIGHAHGEAVLLARRGMEIFAVEASCTHYGGPLQEGLLVGDTVRCPWHHACFSLRTGQAVRAPALKPLACYSLERRGSTLVVLGRSKARATRLDRPTQRPSAVVIVGGGAAGHAAAEALRTGGYTGKLTLLSADADPPCDRPNLSKDYLAGNAPEEWIPLRPPEFFRDQEIELVLGTRVTAIDAANRRVVTATGESHAFERLLLATGAEPTALTIPGHERAHYLRTLADSRAIIAKLGDSRRAVVLGASFIGLEVAAALRARKLEVTVVAPDAVPLQRVLGPELGGFVQRLHEANGVKFQLGQTANRIDEGAVVLANGETLAADLVVAGIGVRPAIGLAEQAGLATDRGILVNEFLETSVPGIFAAGDNARFPDTQGGEPLRIEHWVVAQRQGQVAAKNMLGGKVAFAQAPFFWSQHYDLTISYVGHAAKWDRLEIDGSIEARDATLSYFLGDRKLAVVTLGRDIESLKAEVLLERSVSA